jgi:cellobiose phosphorylase
MNRVGREGRGESVWMGFFLYAVLDAFAPICARRGDAARADRYRRQSEAYQRALNGQAWDGEWYRRGWYDDGDPLGSRESDECRIDALAQAWAVISGAAPRDRVAACLDAVEEHLISDDERLIRLFTPPFDSTPHDPGYIKGYVPGVRENGGQYTHAATWVARAMAEAGRRERAAALLEMLNPVTHALTAERLARYQVEPYVICADVYGAPPLVGRGGWTWYTGSSGWYWRVAVESLLGVRLEGGARLVIDPRVPDDWPEFGVDYRVPAAAGGGAGDAATAPTTFAIRVLNPSRRAGRVTKATFDGEPVEIAGGAAIVPIARDGRRHVVEIELGSHG